MKIISTTDINRDHTLRMLIDALIKNTNWKLCKDVMVDLDEGDFTVQIKVIDGREPVK